MKHHFSFEGRATRTNYWKTQIGAILCGIPVGLIAAILSKAMGPAAAPLVMLLFIALFVIVVWVGVAVAAKRAHDLGHTGWMALGSAIPVVGLGFWIYFGFFKGQEVANGYGPSPYTGQL